MIYIKKYIFLLFLLLLKFNKIDYAQSIAIPKFYKELKESPANGKEMNKIIFDLDGDNISDTALIVQKEEDFSDFLLLIYLSKQKKTISFKLIDNYGMGFNLYPIPLKVKNNVLELGYYQDGTSAFGRILKFRYDKNAKDFRLIGYDSSYKASMGMYCEKSYNLLTGKYIVEVKDLAQEKNTVNTGKKFLNKIYLQSLDISKLDSLDAIGSEFELH